MNGRDGDGENDLYKKYGRVSVTQIRVLRLHKPRISGRNLEKFVIGRNSALRDMRHSSIKLHSELFTQASLTFTCFYALVMSRM